MIDIKQAIRDDGRLYLNWGKWLDWEIGKEEISLDGNFTVEDLEFLVSYMKGNQVKVDD